MQRQLGDHQVTLQAGTLIFLSGDHYTTNRRKAYDQCFLVSPCPTVVQQCSLGA